MSPRHRAGQAHRPNAHHETTPLLASVEPEPISDSNEPILQGAETSGAHHEDENAPLPKTQIFLLCYTRVVEPIAFFSIFPYINDMIEHVGGIAKEDVGFYTGLIESLFSLTQMCVMIFWGKAADRWGRKPCLVLSLFGIAIATTLFGMSQSIWQMVFARCFAGIFAGTVVTVRAMLSENCTKHTQAKAFSYFAFAGNFGMFIGTTFGGVFERPADKFGAIFGTQLFRDYPYILPGMITSIVALSAAITTFFFVEETIDLSKTEGAKAEASMTIWQILNSPGVSRVILINSYVMLLAFTFTAVNPVFLYTPVKMGGMGFPPELIASTMALAGASQAIWLLLVFPSLHKRVGTGQILRYAALVWPVFFAMHPGFNLLLRHGLTVSFWTIAPPALMLGSGVAMAFTCVQLAVNDIAPSHETFGTLNAIVLALQSGLRAIAPAAATSLFATGVKYDILGGHLFWVANVALAVGMIGVLRLLPTKAEGKVEMHSVDYDG